MNGQSVGPRRDSTRMGKDVRSITGERYGASCACDKPVPREFVTPSRITVLHGHRVSAVRMQHGVKTRGNWKAAFLRSRWMPAQGHVLHTGFLESGRTFLSEQIASLAMTLLRLVIARSAATKQSLLPMKSGTELAKSNTKFVTLYAYTGSSAP